MRFQMAFSQRFSGEFGSASSYRTMDCFPILVFVLVIIIIMMQQGGCHEELTATPFWNEIETETML